MQRLAPVLAVLALVAAGCGGGGSASSGDDASGLVPATTPVFVVLDTDFGSDQLKNADAVLKKFPLRSSLLAQIRDALAQEHLRVGELKRAAGPQVDIALLDTSGQQTVGFTKPTDEKAFQRVLDSGGTQNPTYSTKIHGWTAFSDDKAALDAVKHADEKLADVPAYTNATSKLPDAAIAKVYVAGSAVKDAASTLGAPGAATFTGSKSAANLRWLSAALLSHDDGVELQLHLNGKNVAQSAPTYEPTLLDEVPSGALAAFSFDDLGQGLRTLNSSGVPGVGSFEQTLGTNLRKIGEALRGEGMLYVRRGNPIPEVTLVARESNPAQAKKTVAQIVSAIAPGAGATRTTVVDGVTLSAVDLGSVTIFYGTFGGKLVVTDNANAVRDVKGGGNKLSDDKVFGAAQDAVSLPDRTSGFLFLNFKDGLPLVEGLAQLAGQRIPAQLDDNVRPLRSLLAYSSRDGNTATVDLFLQTS